MPPKFFILIFFGDVPIWLSHHSKKMKLWWLPKTEGPILKYTEPPFWPTYIGERRTPFSKAYGIKVRRYGERGKHCKLGNIVQTHWEAGEKWKKISPPTPKHKRKKCTSPWEHAWAFPLAAQNFSSQKTGSPFLGWANTPCTKHPTYLFSVGAHLICLQYNQSWKN